MKTFFHKKLNGHSIHGYFLTSLKDVPTTLIFLHDALGSAESWKDFPSKIFQTIPCNVIVYSRYGHGNSDGLKRKKPIDFFDIETKELHALIETFQIEDPILIGSSDGGTIALKYAAAYNTKAIVTIGAHYMNEKATYLGVKDSMEEPGNSNLRTALQKYHGQKANILTDSWQSNWTDMAFRDWSLANVIPNIECPALILQGDQDEYASKYHVTSMATLIGKNATYQFINNAGHFPHRDNMSEVVSVIKNFIQKIE